MLDPSLSSSTSFPKVVKKPCLGSSNVGCPAINFVSFLFAVPDPLAVTPAKENLPLSGGFGAEIVEEVGDLESPKTLGVATSFCAAICVCEELPFCEAICFCSFWELSETAGDAESLRFFFEFLCTSARCSEYLSCAFLKTSERSTNGSRCNSFSMTADSCACSDTLSPRKER